MKKVNYIMMVLLGIMIISCADQNQAIQESVNVVEKFQKAFQDHDIESIRSVLADDYVGYGPSIGDSIHKDDALLIWDQNLEYMYDKIEMNVAENIAISNVDVEDGGLWISSWGTLTLKFQNVSNEAKILANQIFLVKDGKIKKTIIFYNEADALRQAGYHYTFKEPIPSDK